jgi:hypothetical protein
MTWSDTPINGSQSVAANKSPINNAFTYIADSMKNDHFWDNANSNLDGHHQYVQMPKNESGGVPADPSFATDMDGIVFAKEKTATEAPDKQLVESFYRQKDGAGFHLQQMGFRAMLSVTISGGSIVQNSGNDWDYQHNISAVSLASTTLTVTFATTLPTDNYIVIVNGLNSSSYKVTSKSTTTLVLSTGTISSTGVDLVIVGG